MGFLGDSGWFPRCDMSHEKSVIKYRFLINSLSNKFVERKINQNMIRFVC